MSDINKPPAEALGGFREELHDIGVEIDSLVPENEFSAAARNKTDESGTEHTIVSTKPSNPEGFLYIVEQRYTPADSKSWTWHRAVQEDLSQQKVQETQDGNFLPERTGFDEEDIARIRESIGIIKNQDG